MNTTAEDPAIAEAILKGLRGGADINETQYAQFTHFCRASFYNAEDTYFQHKGGLLSDAAFASFVASVKGWAAGAPGIRAAWRQFRGLFVSEFAEWMDATLTEVAPAAPIDTFARWRKSVAEERGAEGA